jgi:hypothetical protein
MSYSQQRQREAQTAGERPAHREVARSAVLALAEVAHGWNLSNGDVATLCAPWVSVENVHRWAQAPGEEMTCAQLGAVMRTLRLHQLVGALYGSVAGVWLREKRFDHVFRGNTPIAFFARSGEEGVTSALRSLEAAHNRLLLANAPAAQARKAA